MSPDALESEIQDYLDGRMAEPQRSAFETRLAADAELARRVRALREIGAALAGGDEGLSTDFYARLRSRFEASRPARPRWTRTHRWEAYGLAAAALIALVLFVPQLLEDRVSLPTELLERAPAAAQATPVPQAPQQVEPQEAAPRIANEAQKQKKEDSGERRAQSAPARREPARSEPVEPETIERQAGPAPDRAQERDAAHGFDDVGSAAARGAALDEGTKAAAAPAPMAAPSMLAPPTGLPVRPGLVARESVVEIDDRAGWERLDLAAIGRYDPARRVDRKSVV